MTSLTNVSSMYESIITQDTIVRVNEEDVMLEVGYNPLNDTNGYMNKKQLAYFKKRLMNWKDSLAEKAGKTIYELMTDTNVRTAEEGEASTIAEEQYNELRMCDRQRKLMSKIDAALVSIETGKYGYCEQSGDEIGVARLCARPIARLSIAMQELHEHEEDAREEAEYTRNILSIDDSAHE